MSPLAMHLQQQGFYTLLSSSVSAYQYTKGSAPGPIAIGDSTVYMSSNLKAASVNCRIGTYDSDQSVPDVSRTKDYAKVAPGGKAIFVAIGVLLQAAKGITALYNAIESLLRKVNACLVRIKVYLESSSPPNPALVDVLRFILVQVFVVLGIVTKYCDKAGGKDSKSKDKKGVQVIMQRMRDLSRVFLGKNDVEEALKVLEELAEDEGLVAAADTNTVVRQRENLLSVTI
ncbi:hypothetical protein PENSPDRAFT_670205 [Peniophora sp. CONT]|nr:hypothetical protein PENSPDRAFT_670205 [Peniophora sp. CONT]